MKKRRCFQMLALLCLICLWGSLSAFISAPRSTVSYLYECGEWIGKVCGTYWGTLSNQIPSGTLTRKDYGHYNTGGLVYECSHDSKPALWSPTPAICEGCGGSGYVPCPACGGSGWQ